MKKLLSKLTANVIALKSCEPWSDLSVSLVVRLDPMKTIIKIYAFVMLLMTTSYSFSQNVRLFAGRYTETGGKGFTLLDLNPETGAFKLITDAESGPSPSYFCISRSKGYIYAANEVMDFKGAKGGGLTTLKYDKTKGTVEKISDLLVPDGGPCFISLSPDEKYLLLANYSSSSLAVVKLNDKGVPEKVTDKISFQKNGNKESHPHMIAFGPGGRKVYLTDLGFDRVVIYDFDSISGKLSEAKNGIVHFADGAGPRHFVFNSDGTRLYVICELNSTIGVFEVQKDGGLKPLQTISTLAEGYKNQNACADIHIGKNGRFLYGSNRGENTIAVFRIETDGKLTSSGRTSCGGDWPRNFIIDPSGKYMVVANQKSGNIVLFNIDQKSGIPVAASKEFKLDAAVCLKF